MRRQLFIYCVLIILSLDLSGQAGRQNVTGQVSFLSSQNVYVRFGNTEGINVNDTLYNNSGDRLIPALVVVSLSSTSCMCRTISTENLPVGHLIVAKKRPVTPARVKTLDEVKAETPPPVIKNEPAGQKTEASISKSGTVKKPEKQNISGSISAASYSDFSNTSKGDLQRFRYTLSLNAPDIGKTRLSAETYISFRHKTGAWNEVRSDIFNALKIYSLALKYDIDSTMYIKLGRQINPRISNIGSFDGLVAEKTFRRFSTGITGGARPDFSNFGFDPKLLQYGAYASYDYSDRNVYSGTSLAFMEQMNSGKTDRRFLYFQHSGSYIKNLSLFSSFELELLKPKNGTKSSGLDLTSVFASLNYRFSNKLNISGSYDARRNPVYFETFRTLLDSIMESELRQSFRLQANIRLAKPLLLGVQSSWRYLKTDLRQAKNVSGYLSYTHPGINNNYLSVTLSGGYIETSYIKGPNADISFLNSLAGGNVQVVVGYSYQGYMLPEATRDIIQHTGKVDLYWTVAKKLSLSAYYEAVFEPHNLYHRLYLQLIKRF